MANTQINLNGYNIKIRDNMDGTYSTTTSKTVQYMECHVAVAVRDTANNDSSLMDVTTVENNAIFVYNGCNQTATVSVLIYDPSGTYAYVLPTTKTVAATSSMFISAGDFPQLDDPFTKMKVRVAYSVAPTSGSVSTWVLGF